MRHRPEHLFETTTVPVRPELRHQFLPDVRPLSAAAGDD
jgi:hypothetical protein